MGFDKNQKLSMVQKIFALKNDKYPTIADKLGLLNITEEEKNVLRPYCGKKINQLEYGVVFLMDIKDTIVNKKLTDSAASIAQD